MDIDTDAVQRLMEVGFVAAGNGLFSDATEIFDGVEAARPESELPLIGRAFVCMAAARHGDAAPLLKQALEKNPDSELAMSFMGLALRFAGLSQASRDALQQVADSGGQEQAVALAKSLLEAE